MGDRGDERGWRFAPVRGDACPNQDAVGMEALFAKALGPALSGG